MTHPGLEKYTPILRVWSEKKFCSYNMIHVTVVLHVRNEDEHGDTYTYMNEKVIYTEIYTRHDPFLEGVKRMKIH